MGGPLYSSHQLTPKGEPSTRCIIDVVVRPTRVFATVGDDGRERERNLGSYRDHQSGLVEARRDATCD